MASRCSTRILGTLLASAAAAGGSGTASGGLQAFGGLTAAAPTLMRGTVLQAARAMATAASASPAVQDALKPKMFCMQCEQTANGTGCTTIGQCGKTPEVAGLQDLLVFSLKGLGHLAAHARAAGISDPEVDSFCLRASFSTLTNVNFDDARFEAYINEAIKLHEKLAKKLKAAGKSLPSDPPSVSWFDKDTGHPLAWNNTRVANGDQLSLNELMALSKKTGILGRQETLGKTVAGLQELIMYGVKGTCAYAAHAEALGAKDDGVYGDVQKHLAFLASPDAADPGKLLAEALNVGATNVRVMKLLSEAHAGTFGSPTPTDVSTVPIPGKCILVSGHDMHDLVQLLEQTEGTGINIYTHGEMLPAHGYPGLKKYKHLAGHYGGAWYQQKQDFTAFPGAILMTTNCLMEPMSMYRKNIFTTNETGWTGIPHVPTKEDGAATPTKDFSALIKRAQELNGWNTRNMPRSRTSSGGGRGAAPAAAAPAAQTKSTYTVGFGHDAVLGVADKVIDAVKTGKLEHIFVVGGCDGHEPQRAYYAGLGQNLPKNTMLLTMGCGKFRLNNQEFGTLADTGLPRLLDMGQCNDAYSAVVVAQALAKAFNTDINGLPLSLDISWFEQKAVAVLLSLLHLGVKNIRLGPALPAFLTQDALNILVDKYQLKPADTSNPDLDLKKMMRKA